jgi:integrase
LHIDRWGNLKQKLFPGTIAKFVKKWGAFAGLDPRKVSGHSARAGFVTTATRQGKPLDKIMAQTGHVKPDTVLKYVRDAQLFTDCASKGLLSKRAG